MPQTHCHGCFTDPYLSSGRLACCCLSAHLTDGPLTSHIVCVPGPDQTSHVMAKVVGGQFSHNRECLCLYSEPHVGMPVMCGRTAVWTVVVLCGVVVLNWSGGLLLNGFIASFRQTHFLHFPRQKVEQQHHLTWCCDTATVYLFAEDSGIIESLNCIVSTLCH